MNAVALVATVLYYVLLLYFLVVLARIGLDVARNIVRNWRPTGIGLVLSEVVYALTDGPIRAARRVIKPIRVSGMVLDFSTSVVMLVVVVLIYFTLVLQTA